MPSRRRDNVNPEPCPKCSCPMTVHVEDRCVVCERTQADTPCFVTSGKIIVAKIHDPIAEIGEYVGRSLRGRHCSPLGNPFKIKTEAERAAAIERYETWLREKIDGGDRGVVGALDALAARFRRENRLVLVCWCRPYGQTSPACHADVIARVLRERLEQARSVG